jgi:hypothetical protein
MWVRLPLELMGKKMDKNIKNIIDAQIEQQIYKPTQRDVVPHSALLVVDRDGKMDVTHGEGTSIPRLQQFLTTLQPIKLPEMSVLFLTHDYSDPKHYEDKPNFSICFGKLRNQRYITIPNLHLLGGIVDSMFREVSTHDCGMFAKEKSSIFAGGPNCDHDGVRIKYGVKGLDPAKHTYLLTNNQKIPISHQLKHMFTMTIDGHSMCYDRLYWQMYSYSVPVYVERNKNIVQLHDELIKENEHYIETSVDEWGEKFEYLCSEQGQKFCQDIVKNGKAFCDLYFKEGPQLESQRILSYIFNTISDKQKTL